MTTFIIPSSFPQDLEKGDLHVVDVKRTPSKVTKDDFSEFGGKSVAGKSIISIGGKSVMTTATNIPVIIRGVSNPSVNRVSCYAFGHGGSNEHVFETGQNVIIVP